MQFDYLIVGSGLTGSVIARHLRDHGLLPLVVERRSHLGGNVHDHTHESGIAVHTYGPHFFRTSSPRIWRWVNRFDAFRPYEARLRTLVNGRYEAWPVAGSYVRRVAGAGWRPTPGARARNFEEATLRKMPERAYREMVHGYTRKQWGVAPSALAARLAHRFDVRWDDDGRLSRHRHQGLPESGYARFVRRLLEGIPVVCRTDYLDERSAFDPRRGTVYTGPIDALFGHDLGRLAWRGQQREHEYVPGADWKLPGAVVNNPGAGDHVRTIEWKHLMPADRARRVDGTLLTREIPVTPSGSDGLEYPFQDAANAALARRYRERARRIPGLRVCGRLGDYRYYDMDQAIARAAKIAGDLLRAAGIERPRLLER